MSDIAIGVHGLRKHFGEVEALAGADFDVPQGTVFGLLGPNGAGKTTVIRVLSTILRPDTKVGVISLTNSYLGPARWTPFRDIQLRMFEKFS